MAFHHVAIATRDLDATHRFYTEAMGFELVKVEAAPTPDPGWARHLFYDTGNGEMLAIWDLHVPSFDGYRTEISTGLGLPPWVNHIAFQASSLDELATRRQRLLEHGHDVIQIDHGWCTSIYANDPNGAYKDSGPVVYSGSELKSASPGFGQGGEPQVNFTTKDPKKFADMTRATYFHAQTSDQSLRTASSAATTVGCAASAARSSCRQAYTPAGGDRGRVDEIQLRASCCRTYTRGRDGREAPPLLV